MEQEVLRSLIAEMTDETIHDLCDICSIRKFQAVKYIEMYQKLTRDIQELKDVDTTNLRKNRDNILRRLVNGEYSTNEAKSMDFKNEIIRILQSDTYSEAISALSELCNIAEGDAAVFYEKFKNIKYNETGLSSVETSDAVNARWEIINLLAKMYQPDRPF